MTLTDKLVRALKQRPVRIVEALVVIAGAFGVVVSPETEQTVITTILTAVTVIGGEAAQTKTNSKEYLREYYVDAEEGTTEGPGEDVGEIV